MNRYNNVFMAKARAKFLYENVTPWTDEVMTIIKNEFNLSHKHYDIVRRTLPWYKDRMLYCVLVIGLAASCGLLTGIL